MERNTKDDLSWTVEELANQPTPVRVLETTAEVGRGRVVLLVLAKREADDKE